MKLELTIIFLLTISQSTICSVTSPPVQSNIEPKVIKRILGSRPCPSNCKACKPNYNSSFLTICTQCKDGFFILNDVCIPCKSKNCRRCDPYNQKCLLCNHFYTQKGKDCHISIFQILVHIILVLIIIFGIYFCVVNWRVRVEMKNKAEVEAEL